MFYKYTDSYIVIHIVISCSVLVNIIKDINSAPQISHVHFFSEIIGCMIIVGCTDRFTEVV